MTCIKPVNSRNFEVETSKWEQLGQLYRGIKTFVRRIIDTFGNFSGESESLRKRTISRRRFCVIESLTSASAIGDRENSRRPACQWLTLSEHQKQMSWCSERQSWIGSSKPQEPLVQATVCEIRTASSYRIRVTRFEWQPLCRALVMIGVANLEPPRSGVWMPFNGKKLFACS